jgi:hypothetical protein
VKVAEGNKLLTLLHSATMYSLSEPGILTGGKGDPVEMSALPSDHLKRSFGLLISYCACIDNMQPTHSASHLLIGLLRGKMIGRSVLFDMSQTYRSASSPVLL